MTSCSCSCSTSHKGEAKREGALMGPQRGAMATPAHRLEGTITPPPPSHPTPNRDFGLRGLTGTVKWLLRQLETRAQ